MKLSIIIPYHNEGIDFIGDTVRSIMSTIDINDYEIIIVDDYSDEPCRVMIPITSRCLKIIRHETNKGVGAAFDTGIKEAKSDNLFLMGCDIRFEPNKWASKMVREIKTHPNSLICSSVVGLWESEQVISFEQVRRIAKVANYNGASILLFHGHSDTPDRPEDFRSILDAQWLPREYLPLRRPGTVDRTESYEVACILGAAYGTTKKWYKHLDGFWGHKRWGTLEPYISLKSHLFGGKCYTAPHIEVAHIFKNTGSHGTGYEFIAYNKLLVSWLLFPLPDKDRLINYLNPSEFVSSAKVMIEEDMADILKKREEYRKKTKLTMKEIVAKFNLRYD